MTINILIPMTGPNRLDSDEYVYPKPLIDIGGKTIIQRCLESFDGFQGNSRFIPVISLEDVRDFNLDYVLRQLVAEDQLKLIELENSTGGALCTALLAIEEIDNDNPLIVTNGDHVIDYDVPEIIDWFERNEADFGAVTFEAVHPKWSYVRFNDQDEIEEAAEKRPISKHAIAGFYYFSKGSDFVAAAQRAILKRSTHAGRYFLSSSLNEMVLMGKRGLAYRIPNASYTNFYDVSAVKSYIDRCKQRGLQNENEIRRLTRRYVAAFHSRRLEEVSSMMHEEFVLEDPVIKRIESRERVTEFLREMFGSAVSFSFAAVDVATFHDKSFIQFQLEVDDKRFRGVDVITWSDGRMESLVAHMDEVGA